MDGRDWPEDGETISLRRQVLAVLDAAGDDTRRGDWHSVARDARIVLGVAEGMSGLPCAGMAGLFGEEGPMREEEK